MNIRSTGRTSAGRGSRAGVGIEPVTPTGDRKAAPLQHRFGAKAVGSRRALAKRPSPHNASSAPSKRHARHSQCEEARRLPCHTRATPRPPSADWAWITAFLTLLVGSPPAITGVERFVPHTIAPCMRQPRLLPAPAARTLPRTARAADLSPIAVDMPQVAFGHACLLNSEQHPSRACGAADQLQGGGAANGSQRRHGGHHYFANERPVVRGRGSIAHAATCLPYGRGGWREHRLWHRTTCPPARIGAQVAEAARRHTNRQNILYTRLPSAKIGVGIVVAWPGTPRCANGATTARFGAKVPRAAAGRRAATPGCTATTIRPLGLKVPAHSHPAVSFFFFPN